MLAMGVDGRKMLGLGLSRVNMERLQCGLPIHFNAEQMGLADLSVKDVVILFGETEDVIREKFFDAGWVEDEHTRTISHGKVVPH